MTKISIQGVLVDATYDTPELQWEISNGVLCPSSHILRQIDEANGDDIEISLNSEGGDVFAFNEVANRLSSYPGDVKIVIGSCAFSEAANLALTCGRPVYVHPNSVMLWHSAMSTIEDGAVGELRAEAEILERINAPVKNALKIHGIPEYQVERGFEDRNALVLGADELVKYGIAQLIGTEALPTPRVDEALSIRVAALAKANQRIAAHFAKSNQRIDDVNKVKMDTDTNILTEEEKKRLEDETVAADEPEKKQPCADENDKPEETENTDDTENTGDEQPTEETKNTGDEQTEQTEETTEEQPAEEDSDDEMVKALEVLQNAVTELRQKTDDFEVRIKSLEDKLATKEVELEDAKKALKAERTRRIGAIAAAVSGKAESSGPADWPSAVKACKGDKLEAYKRYPELAKQWAK